MGFIEPINRSYMNWTIRPTLPAILLLAALALSACEKNPLGNRNQQREDFGRFYSRFHEDSVFQLERIVFPLEGLPDNAVGQGIDPQKFRWEKETWKTHRPIDFSKGSFKQELAGFGEDLIIERIVHESGDYAMLRRFSRMNGKWNLIYYAGLNPVAKAE
ncbi:MAG: hypothetical protein KIPDCIKN_03610 [Haliscomenobacter sp.]|jgi:hypothetical protein|nr:hypothetical protein [Haliscomenobacter sp.]